MADITQAMRKALDHIEIGQLIARYCRGVDRLDAALIESVYWPDGFDDHAVFSGDPKAFAAWAVERLGQDEATAHLLGQSTVVVDGDRAAGETYFFAQHLRITDGNEFIAMTTGRYLDTFERRGGEWRILRRKLVLDVRRVVSVLPGQPLPGASDDAFGRRGRADASYAVLEPAR